MSKRLEQLATAMILEAANRELCRECGVPGVLTGEQRTLTLYEYGEPMLELDVAEYTCAAGHMWHTGEGRAIGHDGILTEKQITYRQGGEQYVEEGEPVLELDDGGGVAHTLSRFDALGLI